MNLWVRSQYKEILFKVNNNLIIRHNDNVENGMYFIECDSCKIAMYKTREKALEVLDEIQNILKPQLIIKDSGKIIGSFEDTIVREGATYELKELSTYVYQMPKD